MRFSLAKKITIIFFSLNLITFILAAIVIGGLKEITHLNEYLFLINRYEQTLNNMAHLQEDLEYHPSTHMKMNLNGNIQKIKNYLKEFEAYEIDSSMMKRINHLKMHLVFFEKAFNELYEKVKLDDDLLRKNSEIINNLFVDLNYADNGDLLKILNELTIINSEIYNVRDYNKLSNLKNIKEKLAPNGFEQDSLNKLLQIIDNFEKNYFNYLGVLDRRSFLKNSSKKFRILGDDFTELLRKMSQYREKKVIYIILILIICFLSVTLIWWFIVSNYFRKFLKHQNYTINSISEGRYDYTDPHALSNDELGDLTIFMRSLSQKIKKTLSELTESENNLKKMYDYNETLIDSMFEAVAIIDVQDYKILKVNSAFLKLEGLEKKDVIGKTCFEIIHNNIAPCETLGGFCPLYECLKTGENITVEHNHFDKNGTPIYEEICISPIKSNDGKIMQVVHSSKNISQRKSLEARLTHSNKMESIGRLASGVAHDFNNILSLILGYSELARMDIKEEGALKESMDIIYRAGKKGKELTNQLLTFSRKQVLNMKIINLNNLIKNNVDMIKRIAGEDIEVVFNDKCEKVNIKADPNQIDQIFINLTANARDSMKNGGRLFIEINSAYMDKQYSYLHPEIIPGIYVQVVFSDTGEGMSKETSERLFEPFFTTKEKGKGTGLGLAIIYGIIKQHKGYVYVYSEINEGTTFKIYFPIENNPEDQIQKLQKNTTPLLHGNETILVVDDDEEIHTLGKKILQSLGYTVFQASSGKEALKILENNKIDMMLTDVVMPGMRGTELVERVGKLHPEVKLAYMSGYSENIVIKEEIKGRKIHFLNKPIVTSNLAAVVRAALDEE